jgi:Bacterial Ig-like domain
MTTNTTQNAPTSAIAVSSFLDSIGVNIHTSYTNTVYANTALVESALAYLGIDHVRDGLPPVNSYGSVGEQILTAAGYKFDFVMETPTATSMAALNYYATNYAGSVFSVEGPNEVGYAPISFDGGTAASNEVALQQAIFNATHSDPDLKGVNVINLTLGLQSSISYSQLGNMTSAADEGNAHVYAPYGFSPAYDWNSILSEEGAPTSGLPMVITEAGYTTDTNISGVDQTVQAKYTLDLLMDAAKSGVAQIYLYELLDEFPDPTGTNDQDNYGLFNNDGTPKLAATAIHNLTTILADPSGATSFQTGTLAYTVAGLPSGGSQVLFEKENGTYDIALWAEPNLWNSTTQQEIVAPTEVVTVKFAQVEHEVLVFDPLLGTTPIASYTNVSQVQVSITDHPLIIEVENTGTPAGTFQAAPTIVSYSPGASAIGSGLSNLKQITLAGDAAADSTVTIFDGTTALGSVTALGNGTWSYTTGVLADGTHNFTAIDSSSVGISAASSDMVVTNDAVVPNAPNIVSFSPDTALHGGAFANASVLVLHGTAEANTTVNIYDGTKDLGTASVNSSGAWTFTTGKLGNGVQTFTATDTDAFGNTGAASPAFAVTVDTSPVAAPTFSGFSPVNGVKDGDLTDANHLTLAGTAAAGTTVTLFDGSVELGTAVAASTGAWTFATGLLADGNNIFTAIATDAAGTVSPVSSALDVVVDTVAPSAPVVASFSPDTGIQGDGITNVNHVTLCGTAVADSTVQVYDGTTLLGHVTANASGAWTYATGTLANGVHAFTATDTNAAGDVSAASKALDVTIDTHVPATPTITSFSPDTGIVGGGITDANHLILTGLGEANSTINVFDHNGSTLLGTASVNSAGVWNFSTGELADGAYIFKVTDTDAAGTTSASSSALDVTIDTTVPNPTFTNVVENSNGTWTLSGTSEATSTVSIFDNGSSSKAASAVTAANGTWSVTLSLPNGVNSLTTTATDPAGNAGTGTNSVVIGSSTNGTINGSHGALLAGGAGSDTFVFASNFGKETVTDFHSTGSVQDILQFSQSTFANFAAVMAHAEQVGANTVITLDAADVVTLNNVTASTLHASNFHLV